MLYRISVFFALIFALWRYIFKQQNANLTQVDKIPILIAYYIKILGDILSYETILERPGVIDFDCICNFGCLLHAQI